MILLETMVVNEGRLLTCQDGGWLGFLTASLRVSALQLVDLMEGEVGVAEMDVKDGDMCVEGGRKEVVRGRERERERKRRSETKSGISPFHAANVI